MNNRYRIQVHLDRKTHDLIVAIADRSELSIPQVVRVLIWDALEAWGESPQNPAHPHQIPDRSGRRR